MAKTTCPNGHGMWNGDGTPTVWAYRVRYLYDYMKDNPNCVFGFGDRLWQIYDCVDDVPGEYLDCWYCDECQGLVVFVDNLRYDFNRMEDVPDITLSDVESWEEYIALRDDEFDRFTDFYDGKSPVWAIENYPFRYKYRVSPDKKTIYAFDPSGNIQFGYQQVHFTDFGPMEQKRPPRDVHYPYNPEEHPKPLFEGELKKLQLISNSICYGPCPGPDDEVEQHLTITSDGRVWFSSYCYGDGIKYRLLRRNTYKVAPETASIIMDAISSCFSQKSFITRVTDVGSWDATLTNTEGVVFKINGSLLDDLETSDGGLSDIIRNSLSDEGLYAFDGNPDSVTRLEVLYHRVTKMKPKVCTDVLPEQFTWDYSERLIVDGNTDTIEYSRQIGNGCKVTSTFYVEEGVSDLLDGMNEIALSSIRGTPEDVIEDPSKIKDYEITVSTKQGQKHTVSGIYDKDGLPECWPDVIKEIDDFMAFYGIGEIFDKRIYAKPKRRKSDLVFCNVEFEDGGRTYCYIADSDDYAEGDYVVVPAGFENREAVVRIESIEYHPPEEAPYPVEKTKHILRKYLKDKNDA